MREHTLDDPRGRLRIRWLRTQGESRALLLEEQRGSPPAMKSLRALGLTSRQAQVLRLLTCGKRNEEIARELSISVGTVRKHLQHVYAQLGVSSRAEAIATLRA